MKKLLMAAALFMSTFAAKADDAITASLKVTSDKSAATVHVNLDNPSGSTYVAFQFDITFPSDMKLSNEKPTISARLENDETINLSTVGGSETESTTFKVETNWLPGNVLRVIGYNLGNKPIKQTSGEILTIKVNAESATQNVSDWSATFNTIDFVTETELNEMQIAISGAQDKTVQGVEESTWKLGDVNHDGQVTIGDGTATLKYILYGCNAAEYKANTGKEYYSEQGDINGKDGVTIADAIAILKSSL